MNFVKGGSCYATGGRCLLGLLGVYADNRDGDCELHGRFDVWLMETNDVLVSDIGCPSGEPKQSLAIGVNEALARNIAKEKTEKLRTSIITTERSCMKCHARFWATSHKAEEGLRATGKGYLCPECASNTPPVSVERYWCG